MNKHTNIFNKLNKLIFDKTNFIVLQESDLISIKDNINNKINLKINKLRKDLDEDFNLYIYVFEKIEYVYIKTANVLKTNFLDEKEKIILNKIYLDIDLLILDLNTIEDLKEFKNEINQKLDNIISKEKNYEEFFNEDVSEYQKKVKNEIVKNFKDIVNIELKDFDEIEENIRLLEKSEKIIQNLNFELFHKIEEKSNLGYYKELDIIYSTKNIVSKIMYKLEREYPNVYDILLSEKNIINNIIKKEPKHLTNYIYMLEDLYSHNEKIKLSEINIIIDMINNIKENNEEIKIELLFDLDNPVIKSKLKIKNNKEDKSIKTNKYLNYFKDKKEPVKLTNQRLVEIFNESIYKIQKELVKNKILKGKYKNKNYYILNDYLKDFKEKCKNEDFKNIEMK